MLEKYPKLLAAGRWIVGIILVLGAVAVILSGAGFLGSFGEEINRGLNMPVGEMKVIWLIFIVWLFRGR
jgi:hypothetical protein